LKEEVKYEEMMSNLRQNPGSKSHVIEYENCEDEVPTNVITNRAKVLKNSRFGKFGKT
jgi:hypothetical protein